eukprot:CAMPEP_0177744710 /NCGR_PEP_ID=MMETSP0484_2-20121128/29909_1 /TAXON_ID=354590 /ORGANISM="Rhodomonas lens, Strain RHODO" /LENGTH=423 /DNA_ID=CAMNT_0019259267 /DNA_START=271 /DNA_END=1542 /DNA_ORIENTATION=-
MSESMQKDEKDHRVADGATIAVFPNLARSIGSLSPILVQQMDSVIVHFLPKNYQTSVPPSYFTYSKWYSIGAIANSASLVLSTQSMLYAVGLGAGAIPVAAALNWVLKDGLGQLGGILFTSYVNNRFDADPKRWRMVAALILDLSSFLEAATPLFPALFLPFAALGNAGKNISWLAASATRASVHVSFAQRSNLSDLTGKAGSQGVLCSLLGTTLGVSLSPLLGTSPYTIIPALAVFSAVHLFCMHKALKSVALNTLNTQALDIVTARYIASGGREVLSREAVGKEEEVIGSMGSHLVFGYTPAVNPAVLIGPDVTRMAEACAGPDALAACLEQDNFAVARLDGGKGPVGLLLEDSATARHTLLGYLEASLIRGGKDREAARAFRIEHGEAWLRGLEAKGWNTVDVFAEEFRARVELRRADGE